MPERDPVVTNPDHATVVSLEAARLNRTTGLRKAVRITSTAAHTEGMYFQSILNDVFEDPEEVIRCVGEPLLMSEATTCEVPTSRVSEVRGDNGVTKLTVAVNPEEYEWLTANLEFFDWDRDAEIIQPGQLLGRYYRLVQATSYILETRGHVDYNADAFADELLVDDHKISLAPNLGNSDTRKDTARLRLAGGFVLRSAIDTNANTSLVQYLKYSIEERIKYALRALAFSVEYNTQLPPDLDKDLPHWKGVCLPLSAETPNISNLWSPDRA